MPPLHSWSLTTNVGRTAIASPSPSTGCGSIQISNHVGSLVMLRWLKNTLHPALRSVDVKMPKV